MTVAHVDLKSRGTTKIESIPKKTKNESVEIREKKVASIFSSPSDSLLQCWHV
jgi:hypothetical protein